MKPRIPVILLTCLIMITATALAQFDTAVILGTVRDPNGAVLSKATVTLKNLATGVMATAQTDEGGNYQFFNVKIGSYQVVAEAPGFAKAVADNIQVTVNARQRIDLALKAGAVTDSVVITDAARLLETESSDRGQVINPQQIVNLPLNGRSYADLALLAPGVRRSILAAQESGARDASFNVNGLRSALNNFTLDGVDNNFYGTSNQGFSNQVAQPSPDALQEFKVQTDNFSAEFGRAGGAVINASLRSGANEFHGSLYDYLRNTSLNAVGFFKPTRNIKPVLIQNQFGGTVGGPIIKDRAFFFLDYEGFRRITRTINGNITTIPTLSDRQGILGVDARIPFDFVDSNGTLQKAGATIKAGSPVPMTAFAKKVLADLPAPTSSALSNNFESLPRNKFYNDKADLKVDHNFSGKTTAFVRLSHRKMNNYEAPTLPEPLFSGNGNAFIRVINQELAGGVTRNLSSSSLIEFRLGVSRTKAGKTPTGVGGPNMFDLYGITGLPTDPSLAGGLNTQTISGYSGLGRQSSNPQHQDPTVVNPRVNYTFLVGKHSFKTGYEYQHIDTVIEDFHPKYGEDVYSGQFSRPAGAASDNRYNLADFFFGARSSYSLNNTALLNYRQRMHFAYVQDDFKLSPKLTLNLGLRYEFATPQYEADNHLANFDPATGKLIQAKDGSLYDRSGVHPDLNNFAPRIGLAYMLTPRTTIRSGYGISYVHFNRLGGENILGYNGPFIVGASISQQPVSQGVPVPLCVGDNFLNCFRPTQSGYPNGLTSPANFSPLASRVDFTPSDIRTGYVQSWHLTAQRELLPNLLLEVAYVGNHSVKLVALADYNQARPNATNENTALQARRPIPGYSFIEISFPGGQANYHALQAKLERRFSGGLYLLNSFTWSKAIDNVAGHLEANFGDNSRINFRNMASDRGLSNYNQPLNNTTSVVYDLPFGKGRKFASGMSKYADAVIGGWRLIYNPSSAFQVGSSLTGFSRGKPRTSGRGSSALLLGSLLFNVLPHCLERR
ncbi:MAG: TonB-dependent receptor, partial [Chloracidobacterium sp.]|nr:TonB-dependent receptor [Chloracidobacterium sp.]